jgi:hypothetical protein
MLSFTFELFIEISFRYQFRIWIQKVGPHGHFEEAVEDEEE